MPNFFSLPSTTANGRLERRYEASIRKEREAFERILRKQSEQLVRQWQKDLEKNLRTSLGDALRDAGGPSTHRATQAGDGGIGFGNIFNAQSLNNLFSQALRVIANQSEISRNTVKTARSVQTQNAFRTSRAQRALALQEQLSISDRNT